MAVQTIQPSTKDNYMPLNFPDENQGTNVAIKIINLSAAVQRSLITFDVSGYTAGSANITSVKLNLYYASDNGDYNPSGLQVNVYKMLRNDWEEGDGTENEDSNWNDYKTGTNWGTAGCGNSTSDYTTTNAANTTFPASYGWMEWDITEIVKDAIDNVSSIVNLMVRFNAENLEANYSNVSFHSRHYATDTSLRPKLVITYTNPNIVMEVTAGNYTITGADIGLNRTYQMLVNVGNYIISGSSILFNIAGWLFPSKNTSTWTQPTKNTPTYTEPTKNDSTYTYKDKN
jgi:hypothetical protein